MPHHRSIGELAIDELASASWFRFCAPQSGPKKRRAPPRAPTPDDEERMLGQGENGKTYAIGKRLVRKQVQLKKNKDDKSGIDVKSVQNEVDMQVALNDIDVGPIVRVKHKDHKPLEGSVVMDRLHPLPKPIFCMSAEFQENLVAQVFRMVCGGYLHNDLHAGNVMMTSNGNPVIIDFGLCTKVEELANTKAQKLQEQCAMSQLQMLCDPSNINTWAAFVNRDERIVLSTDDIDKRGVCNMCTGDRAEEIMRSMLTDYIYQLRTNTFDYDKISKINAGVLRKCRRRNKK